MSTKTKLQALYDAIPAFDCQPGCTGCCGPVPFSKAEWAAVKDKRELTLGINCPYAQDGKCDIYAQRPFMCRIFGASTEPRLKCPMGCGPEKPLTAEQAARLTARYRKLMDK